VLLFSVQNWYREMHMNSLMLNTAQELSSAEAGGHGDRWGVFAGGTETAIRRVMATIKDAELVAGIIDKAAMENVAASGEPKGVLLLYTGQEKGVSKTGAMSLIGQNEKTGRNELWSAYPMLGDGVEVNGVVERLLLHPNHVEATLEIGLESGVLIKAFDPLFCQTRALYREGEPYRFSLSALAYSMSPPGNIEKVIDDPAGIRRFRAMEAWGEEHGQCENEDEAAALSAWQPETPKDLDPIRINIGGGTMLVPSIKGFSDDALYLGEVVRVTPDAVRILDTGFWRVDVIVIRDDEAGTLTVPIYVAETLFEGEWRPGVGEHVTGNVWMQAYAKAPR
jgi:hypothetical protein